MWGRLKKYWWLCVILAAIILIIGWQKARCDAQEQKCRADYAAQEGRLYGFSIDGNAAEQEAINAACEPNSEFCRLFSSTNLPTMLLVFVGFGGVWAALRTIGTLEKQADAALLNAQALINAERAWVMVEIKLAESPAIVHSTSANGTESTVMEIDIVCSNAGPTPAWVYEKAIRVKVTKQVIMSGMSYPTPEMSETGTTFHKFYEIQPLSTGMPPSVSRATIQCDGWATDANGLQTYVYGYVKYRDAFSLERMTWFGYHVRKGRLQRELARIPNEAYNKNT